MSVIDVMARITIRTPPRLIVPKSIWEPVKPWTVRIAGATSPEATRVASRTGVIRWLRWRLSCAGLAIEGWSAAAPQRPNWAKPAIVIMAVWGAGNAMVVYLAGLQDVPTSLYEAALIDGAGFFQRLFNVTIPMISPVIYFNVVLSIISGFQAFTQAFIMTGSTGAPERSTLFYVLNLYNVGFQDLRMGYASAMAWVLFVIILVITFAATRLSRSFVSYDR